jgi:3-polyprenyl-4-hydroxybenzoate decarboxylase
MGAFMVAASVSVAVKAYSDYPDHMGSLTSTVASAASANAVASPVLSMSDKAALLTPARIATIGAIGGVTGFASGFLVRASSCSLKDHLWYLTPYPLHHHRASAEAW